MADSRQDRRAGRHATGILKHPASRNVGAGTEGRRTAWTEVLERRRRRIRIAIRVTGALLATAFLAAIAMGGYVVYLDWKMGRGLGTGLEEALADRVPDKPFYMVIMGKDAREGETKSRSDTLMLARVDAKEKRVTLLSIPRDTRVEIPGYKTTKINAAAAHGGPALVVETVSAFAGVPVSHYVEVDFEGFRALVDALGGVNVDVPVQIEDRNVGTGVIVPGLQRLNGNQALMLVRSRDFPSGDLQRIANQQVFMRALAKEILAVRNPARLRGILAGVAETVSSDMSVAEMVDLGLGMRGMNPDAVETAAVPGEPSYVGGVSYIIHDEAEFAAMMARIDTGEPLVADQDPELVVPTDVRVVVRNGVGTDGIALKASTVLTDAGFDVVETGNAKRFGYDETLVIHSGESSAMAKAVLEAIGTGSVVPSNGQYAFDGDVLVVVGQDWVSAGGLQ